MRQQGITHQEYRNRILILDDDIESYGVLIHEIKRQGYRVELVSDPEILYSRMRADEIDTVIIGIETRNLANEAMEIIRAVKRIDALLPVIMISSDDSIETAAYIREKGVFYYTLRPIDTVEVLCAIENAVNWRDRHRSTGSRSSENI